MISTIIIVIVVVALLVILLFIPTKKKKKEETSIAKATEKTRPDSLSAPVENCTRHTEVFQNRVNVEREKSRILLTPAPKDYTEIKEEAIGFDLPLPRVSSNIYFISIKANLVDKTRGVLVARFGDIGKYFIDLAMLKGISKEMLSYWFPANKGLGENPSEIYNNAYDKLKSEESHYYFIRYDSQKGFMSFDGMKDMNDPIGTSSRFSSYILFVANGFKTPNEDFYRSKSPFVTEPVPCSLPNDSCQQGNEDSDVRFHVSQSDDIRFRITTNDSGPYPRDIDSLLSSVPKTSVVDNTAIQTKRKNTDEQYSDEVKNMLAETLDNIRKLQLNGVSLNLIQALIGKTTRLSEIRITNNYKVVLTDFNNLEIQLNPLQTTVYLFFLNHPEGVTFYDLPDHKKELMSIYGHMTGRSDVVAIEQSIDALVDRFNGSISTQCSRIRKAFITVVSEDIAKNYYIDGKQGDAKKISIPRSYVRRDDLRHTSADFSSVFARKGKEYIDLIEASDFKSFTELTFLLRPLDHIEFRKGYVPDAFWCGTKNDRYLRLYACLDGSEKMYPVCPEGSEMDYDDTMFLEGIYSEAQCHQVPPITDYIKASDVLGLWEAYLFSITEKVIPHLKGSTAESRRYVMSHRDLVEILGKDNYDKFSFEDSVIPTVTKSEDGGATIECCYASSTENGLCKEIVHAKSVNSSIIFETQSVSILQRI